MITMAYLDFYMEQLPFKTLELPMPGVPAKRHTLRPINQPSQKEKVVSAVVVSINNLQTRFQINRHFITLAPFGEIFTIE
jgi:hypothetical protein